MATDVADASNVVPEDLSANIKNSEVVVTTVTERNCVNTHDVASTVWNVGAVRRANMVCAVYVATNAVERIAASIKETKTGAFSV